MDEGNLARRLLAALPTGALLLADQLYGCGAWAHLFAERCTEVGSHFLVRARGNLQVREIERHADGSRLVEVLVREAGKPRREWAALRLREVLGSVRKTGQSRARCACGRACWMCTRTPRSHCSRSTPGAGSRSFTTIRSSTSCAAASGCKATPK